MTHQLGFNCLLEVLRLYVGSILLLEEYLFFIIGILLTFLVDVYTILSSHNCPYLIYYVGHVSNVSIYFGFQLLQHFIEIPAKLLQIFSKWSVHCCIGPSLLLKDV